MNLSANFTLEEMVKSQTALRCDIDNTPSEEHIAAMRALAAHVLQPVREHFGKPVRISSGYRCVDLCTAVGSKPTSQHAKGEAADFEIPGVGNPVVAAYIRDNLVFDQLILEFYDPDEGPNSGWVHCSYVEPKDNRNMCLTINKSGTKQGLLA